MPTQDLIAIANIGPGTFVSPNYSIPLGTVLSDVEIVSNAWGDPAFLWSIDVEKSTDGGVNWSYWFGARGTGEQGYDKLGNPIMPRLGVNLTGNEPQTLARATISLSKKIRIGLRGITG